MRAYEELVYLVSIGRTASCKRAMLVKHKHKMVKVDT